MKDITHLIMWIFVGAIVVLIVTHAPGFSTAVSAVGGQVTNNADLLAGYEPSSGGKSSTPNPGGSGSAG